MANRRSPRRTVFVWHRYFGLTLALLAIVLAVTGWMLNHTEWLDLDSRYVQSSWLLGWYGIEAPSDPVSFPVEGRWVTRLGERLYLDGEELPGRYGELTGAVALPQALLVAVEGQLLLLTPTGEIIESLGSAENVPADLQGIGVNPAGEPVLKTAYGYYAADRDLLAWRETEAENVAWASASEPPAALYGKLVERYVGTGLSWERLILDLHSGRLFGELGVWVADLASLLLLLLAATGIWMWFRQRR